MDYARAPARTLRLLLHSFSLRSCKDSTIEIFRQLAAEPSRMYCGCIVRSSDNRYTEYPQPPRPHFPSSPTNGRLVIIAVLSENIEIKILIINKKTNKKQTREKFIMCDKIKLQIK